jgi:hypothetical protein
MMARNDTEPPWTRQLLVGLVALVLVALLVGDIVSVVALGAARVAGISVARPSATAGPSLYFPSGDPTTAVDPYPAPAGRPHVSASRSPSPTSKPRKKPAGITLQASPPEVPPGGRITLTGAYPGHEGAQLQVQRFQGGWVDFPVRATVSGGTFATYIMTTHTGVNRLRVTDPAGARASAEVQVTVR